MIEEQKCRICGCTWNNACEGGCYWVEDDLCSQCAGIYLGDEHILNNIRQNSKECV